MIEGTSAVTFGTHDIAHPVTFTASVGLNVAFSPRIRACQPTSNDCVSCPARLYQQP
jgi:hypothetical protein